MIGFCSFEAQVNSIADEMAVGHGLSVHDKAVLQEKEVRLENGKFSLQKGLKIYRLEDRFMFLHVRFSATKLDKTEAWWAALQNAVNLRNELTHPKASTPSTRSSNRWPIVTKSMVVRPAGTISTLPFGPALGLSFAASKTSGSTIGNRLGRVDKVAHPQSD